MLETFRHFDKEAYHGVEDFYNAIHDGFDLTHPSLKYTNEVISRHVPRAAIDGKTVLDAGCGYQARVIRLLLQAYAPSRITGIDVNPVNIQHCREMSLDGDVQFICKDLEKEHWADGSFDVIICEGVLMYTVNPEQNIKKFAAALKPGGYLVLGIYCWKPPYLWFNALSRRAGRIIPFKRLVMPLKRRNLLNYTLINLLDSMYVPVEKYFNIHNVRAILSDLGLTIQYCGLAPSYLPFLKKQSRLVTKICGNRYYHLVVRRSLKTGLHLQYAVQG